MEICALNVYRKQKERESSGTAHKFTLHMWTIFNGTMSFNLILWMVHGCVQCTMYKSIYEYRKEFPPSLIVVDFICWTN